MKFLSNLSQLLKVAFFLFISVTTVFSHSQTPTKFGGKEDKLNSISTKRIKIVPISIQNLNSYKQQYHILVDNQKVGTTDKLNKHQVLKLKVPVMINKKNTLETHNICTLSIPNSKKEMFKTKICTKVYLYWIQK